MRFHIEPQQLANRVCEVALFLLVRIGPRTPDPLFRQMAGPFLSRTHPFRDSRRRVIRNLSGAFGQSYSAATRDGLVKGIQQTFF